MPLYGSYGYNYPMPPRKQLNYDTFPNDLIAPGRNFYTEITFMEYNIIDQLTSRRLMIPLGGVRLPIPRKVNEVQTLTWNTESAKSAAVSILQGLAPRITAVGDALLKVGSAAAGITINPLLFMTFEKPNYRDHTLSWSLAPDTPEESRTIVKIANYIKFNSLPRQSFGGTVLNYPNIANIKLFPDDMFTMIFRPCAVMGVQVDYTGSGGPSFFFDGAPTVVNLTIQLREIQLWDQTNYNGQGGVLGDLDNIRNNVTAAKEKIRNAFS